MNDLRNFTSNYSRIKIKNKRGHPPGGCQKKMEDNNMKKITRRSFLAAAGLGAAALALTACGGSGSSPASSGSSAPAASASAGAAAGYAGGSYALQMAHIGAGGSIEETVSNRFKELVEEATDGKVTVEIFGNGQLGGLTDLVDGIRYDTLDMALFAAGNMESYNPKGTILGVPYLFSSYKHVENFYGSDAWKNVCEELADETNALSLGDFHTGFRDILSNVEIHTAADMKGLVIRVPEAPSFVKTFGALGCNTTALPASDVYQALQTGLVEATEAAPSYMLSMNYQDQAKYCIVTNHIYTGNSIYISKSKLESMDADAQAAIKAAGAQAAKEAWDIVADEDQKALDAFEAAGVTRIDPDLASFKEAMTGVWGELFIDNTENGQELVDAALACDV